MTADAHHFVVLSLLVRHTVVGVSILDLLGCELAAGLERLVLDGTLADLLREVHQLVVGVIHILVAALYLSWWRLLLLGVVLLRVYLDHLNWLLVELLLQHIRVV